MNLWMRVLLLLLVAALAAAGWHWLIADPGYVLVRIHGWRLETTLVVAVVALLLFWAVVRLVWWLLHWPFGAVTRRHRRSCRRRLEEGLVALAEGRHAVAERALGRAARHAPLRAPALLAAAEAASQRGDPKAALEALDRVAELQPQAARVVRARVLRRDGRAHDALALLAGEAESGSLPPAGWREWVNAALLADDIERAQRGLEPLRRSGALEPAAFASVEARVLAAALYAASDSDALDALWSKLSRAQRRQPVLVEAYARRAAALGRGLPAMDEIESALRRQWSSPLAAVYGELEGGDVEARLRRAEGWLDAHPDDAALLGTLGRLCARLGLWGKAREYLQRALAQGAQAGTWEALGDTYAGQDNPALAQRCYHNALRVSRGEPAQPLPGVNAPEAGGPAELEERSEHGVPRLRES
jgi:HemY protein